MDGRGGSDVDGLPVVMVDHAGEMVSTAPPQWLAAQAEPTPVIVWRGRVFLRADAVTGVAPPGTREVMGVALDAWQEVATLVVQTPFGCPVCGVERTDYEGEPGRYLPDCPSCGSSSAPQPVGLARQAAKQVLMPRDLAVALRSELRATTGHWAEGFTHQGEPIAKHDTRGVGGTCVTCSLLELLDRVLYQGRGDGVAGSV